MSRLEKIAEAIYDTHRKDPTPRWKYASPEIQEWVRQQARAAMLAGAILDNQELAESYPSSAVDFAGKASGAGGG